MYGCRWIFLASFVACDPSLAEPQDVGPQSCPLDKAFLQPDEDGTQTRTVRYGTSSGYNFIGFYTDYKVNTDGAPESYAAIPAVPENTPRYNTIVNGVQLLDPQTRGVIAYGANGQDAILQAVRTQGKRKWVRLAGEPIIDWVGIEKSLVGGVVVPCRSGNYYVSKTTPAARQMKPDGTPFAKCDQARWLNANAIPAVVIPKKSRFIQLGASPGDMAVSFLPAEPGVPEKLVFGIVGDVGPSQELGEATPAMIAVLSGKAIPEPSKLGKKGWNFSLPQKAYTLVITKSTSAFGGNFDDPQRNSLLVRQFFAQRWGDGSEALAIAKLKACVSLAKLG